MPTMPKRSEERLGHARGKKEAVAVEKAPGADEVVQPDADPAWCQQAKDLWASLATSGQARYYEPSDWAELSLACWFMTTKVSAGRMSGDDLKALHTVLTDHLVSDGARRRVRLELQRATPEAAAPPALPDGVRSIDSRRAALG